MIFRVNRPEEERIEFFVNGESVATVNHDQHGWSAMDDIQCMFERIAKAVGATVVHTENADE